MKPVESPVGSHFYLQLVPAASGVPLGQTVIRIRADNGLSIWSLWTKHGHYRPARGLVFVICTSACRRIHLIV